MRCVECLTAAQMHETSFLPSRLAAYSQAETQLGRDVDYARA